MRESFLAITSLLLIAQSYAATVTTGFEDLDVGKSFTSGRFVSNGIVFDVVNTGDDEPSRHDRVKVFGAGTNPYTGNYLGLGVSLGLGVYFDVPASEISFTYGALGGSTPLMLNDIFVDTPDKLVAIDGLILDGVSIVVEDLAPGVSEFGFIALSGSINSLVIYGDSELFIDNFSVAIPEPRGALIVSLAFVLLLVSGSAREEGLSFV